MRETQPIPGYRILRHLGAGSFADVFAAEDESIPREVAIKLLRAQTPKADQLERFRRERETLAALNHRHVLRVHSAGSAGGRPYVVTELLPGRTLGDVLQDAHGLDPRDRGPLVDLIHQAALGVAALHAVGLVHRDIKPENLLLDAEGKIKVADLGLVGGLELGSLTPPSAMLGTPSYLAPEMSRGVGTRDPACDVYSLGVTLYEVLTGELPHVATSLFALMVKREGVPNPDPRRVSRAIPIELANVCRRAMEFNPSNRYADAGEFAAALEEARAGRGRRPRSLRVALLLALGVGGLALAPLVLRPIPKAQPPEPPPESVGVAPTASSALAFEEVASRLSARRPGAEAEAARWIAGRPEDTQAAARLREAALVARLLGPPSSTYARELSHPRHVPYVVPLPGGELLWTESCDRFCLLDHPRGNRMLRLAPDGAAPVRAWPGHHVTGVTQDQDYWATLDTNRQAFVYLRSGSTFTPIAEIPERAHVLLADPDVVACGLDDGTVLLLDKTGSVVWSRQVHSGPVTGLAWLRGALVSVAADEVTPAALLSRETGQRVPWGFELPPLGGIRWGVQPAGTDEIVVCLAATSVLHGIRVRAPHRTFAGEVVLNPERLTVMRGPWSPDGVTPRAAVRVGSLLVTLGSQRIVENDRSELRLFDLKSGREVAAKSRRDVEAHSVTYAPELETVLFVSVRKRMGVVETRRLDLGPLASD